jgi:hypothetical protein
MITGATKTRSTLEKDAPVLCKKQKSTKVFSACPLHIF